MEFLADKVTGGFDDVPLNGSTMTGVDDRAAGNLWLITWLAITWACTVLLPTQDAGHCLHIWVCAAAAAVLQVAALGQNQRLASAAALLLNQTANGALNFSYIAVTCGTTMTAANKKHWKCLLHLK
jgi:hypothetical protein